MTHKIHCNSKIAAASQKCGIRWTVVATYAKIHMQKYAYCFNQTNKLQIFCILKIRFFKGSLKQRDKTNIGLNFFGWIVGTNVSKVLFSPFFSTISTKKLFLFRWLIKSRRVYIILEFQLLDFIINIRKSLIFQKTRNQV